MWKWLIGVFVVLALLCGGSGYFLAATESGQHLVAQLRPAPTATAVRLSAVERGSLVRVVSAPGELESKTKIEISAQVSARIEALPFREGDRVRAGDVVVRLDADEIEAQLASARAALKGEEARLEGAKADLVEARAELGRVRELFDTNDVSRAELDAAEARHLRASANLKAAEFAIEIARANVSRAEKNLEYTVITSPIDGTITNLEAEVGELVVIGTLNNPGSVILTIEDLGQMLLRAKVDETNIAPVRVGQRARVYMNAYPERVYEGVVEFVDMNRELDRDGSGFIAADILLRLPEGEVLRTGLTGNAEIEVESFEDVLKVPSQAVLDRRIDELPKDVVEASPHVEKNKTYARVVYTIEGGKARPVPVEVGASDQTHTVVLGGLEEGQRVISGPYKVLVELKDGQAVAEEGAAPARATEVAGGPAGGGRS